MPTGSRLANLTRAPTEPIPLSVLTGFLGSGKTTFLSRVLAVPDLKDTAVIISEFGDVALDHLLLEPRPMTSLNCRTGALAVPCAKGWPIPSIGC